MSGRLYSVARDGYAGALAASFKCARCGWRSGALRDSCPGCKAWGSFSLAGVVEGAPEGEWSPVSFAKVKTDKVERVRLKEPALDRLFGGGLVRSCSYLFDAEPGFGKTTFGLQACQFFEHPLYCVGEQTKGELKLYANRMGIELTHAHVVETKDMELVARHITDEYDALFLDSVHRMRSDDSGAQLGAADQVESVIALGADICRKLGLVGIFISHQNKAGEASGKLSNQHEVAGVLHGQKVMSPRTKKTTKGRTITIEKHRHGPDPATVECVMTAKGLDNFAFVESDEGDWSADQSDQKDR